MLMFYLSLLPQEHHALFTTFYPRYRNNCYTVAFYMLKNAPQAEDAVSIAMLKVIDHFEDFLKIYEKSCEEIGPWVVTIVKNTALDLLKKEGRNVPMDEDWDAPGPADTEKAAEYRRLVELIRSMPETYRQVLELKLVEERSTGEIAHATGLSETAVNSRFLRGRALLREKLRDEGYEYERR